MSHRNVTSRLALVAIGLVLGAGAGEVLARYLGPAFQVVFRDAIAPSEDPVLGYELRAGARDGRNRINSAGMRDHEIERSKPGGTWRLAAVGDSITYGSGVSRDGAFPKQLEQLLGERRRDAAPRVEVLNFGVPGYNITQAMRRLRVRALDFSPDAIVYGYALNDPQAFSIEAEALRRLQADLGPRGGPNALDRWLSRSHLYLLARRIALEGRSQRALRADMPNDPAYDAARSGSRASYFAALHTEGESAVRMGQGLEDLAAIGREAHVPILVVIFPLFGRDVGSGPEALAEVHARVASEASRRGLAVLDLLPVYQAAVRSLGSDLAVDFMHPDPIGQRVAAYAILEWMCGNGWPAADALDCAAPAETPRDAAIQRVVSASRSPASDR